MILIPRIAPPVIAICVLSLLVAGLILPVMMIMITITPSSAAAKSSNLGTTNLKNPPRNRNRIQSHQAIALKMINQKNLTMMKMKIS
jgi:hypothetical protein